MPCVPRVSILSSFLVQRLYLCLPPSLFYGTCIPDLFYRAFLGPLPLAARHTLHTTSCSCLHLVPGVLKYKRDAEELLMKSGLPWTIIRPSRLTDGPYTSFDYHKDLQAYNPLWSDILISHPGTPTQLGATGRRGRSPGP
eukprot:1140195-Pelagomonas_calceolata.AAC.1